MASIDLPKMLALGAGAVALGSGAIWLIKDARSLSDDLGPAKGSLCVNVNTASQSDLESVPGIGETLAVKIVAGRPYAKVDDLVRVSGIGPRSLDGLRPLIRVEGDTGRRDPKKPCTPP
jgi:hypothetical protein